MEKSRLLYKLKEFYVLESYQVDMYNSQINSLEDQHTKRAYEKMVINEQEHVDFFQHILADYGEEPPSVLGSAFEVAGFVTGKALGLLSLRDRYKLGIAVEKKAVEMYYEFIRDARENVELAGIVKNLWYFLIDEEYHQFWFKEHMTRLASENA